MRGRPAQNIAPVVVVWKKSKHGRSKPKMKVFKTKHVDDILDVGVGKSFIETYKKKHKLK